MFQRNCFIFRKIGFTSLKYADFLRWPQEAKLESDVNCQKHLNPTLSHQSWDFECVLLNLSTEIRSSTSGCCSVWRVQFIWIMLSWVCLFIHIGSIRMHLAPMLDENICKWALISALFLHVCAGAINRPVEVKGTRFKRLHPYMNNNSKNKQMSVMCACGNVKVSFDWETPNANPTTSLWVEMLVVHPTSKWFRYFDQYSLSKELKERPLEHSHVHRHINSIPQFWKAPNPAFQNSNCQVWLHSICWKGGRVTFSAHIQLEVSRDTLSIFLPWAMWGSSQVWLVELIFTFRGNMSVRAEAVVVEKK